MAAEKIRPRNSNEGDSSGNEEGGPSSPLGSASQDPTSLTDSNSGSSPKPKKSGGGDLSPLIQESGGNGGGKRKTKRHHHDPEGNGGAEGDSSGGRNGPRKRGGRLLGDSARPSHTPPVGDGSRDLGQEVLVTFQGDSDALGKVLGGDLRALLGKASQLPTTQLGESPVFFKVESVSKIEKGSKSGICYNLTLVLGVFLCLILLAAFLFALFMVIRAAMEKYGVPQFILPQK